MKKFTSVMFILLVLLFFSSVAMAQDTKGIYVGILGGYVIPNRCKRGLERRLNG